MVAAPCAASLAHSSVTAVTQPPHFTQEALLAGILVNLVDGVILERALLQGSGINCPVCLDRGISCDVGLPVSGLGHSLSTGRGEEQPGTSREL